MAEKLHRRREPRQNTRRRLGIQSGRHLARAVECDRRDHTDGDKGSDGGEKPQYGRTE